MKSFNPDTATRREFKIELKRLENFLKNSNNTVFELMRSLLRVNNKASACRRHIKQDDIDLMLPIFDELSKMTYAIINDDRYQRIVKSIEKRQKKEK